MTIRNYRLSAYNIEVGNLYEYTNTMQYVRDLIFLEPQDESSDKRPLKEKLVPFTETKSFLDDYPDEKKNTAKIQNNSEKNSSK